MMRQEISSGTNIATSMAETRQHPHFFASLWRNLVKRFGILLRDSLLTLHAAVKGRGADAVPTLKNSRTATVRIVGDADQYAPGGRKDTFRELFGAIKLTSHADSRSMRRCDCTVLHYLRDSSIMKQQIAALAYSVLGIQPAYFVETSFLSGILGVTADEEIPVQYKKIYSYILDDMGFYFDANSMSRIERFLNSPSFLLSHEEKNRCSGLIRTIVETKLTKYNFQPLDVPDCIQREGKKVLVVDQTFDDASVRRGRGDVAAFERMLADALRENSDATVLIKSHPDRHLQKKHCYFEGIAGSDSSRIFPVTIPVNPYALLEAVDLVYVCTSQMGFEALMAGKRVKTYGMPIYAGWGFTEDTLSCPRRTHKRSVEEIFYALYITFAVHIDPFTSERCSLEQYLESLLRLRAMYFAATPSDFNAGAAR